MSAGARRVTGQSGTGVALQPHGAATAGSGTVRKILYMCAGGRCWVAGVRRRVWGGKRGGCRCGMASVGVAGVGCRIMAQDNKLLRGRRGRGFRPEPHTRSVFTCGIFTSSYCPTQLPPDHPAAVSLYGPGWWRGRREGGERGIKRRQEREEEKHISIPLPLPPSQNVERGFNPIYSSLTGGR